MLLKRLFLITEIIKMESYQAKLTNKQVKEIRRDYIKGAPKYGAKAFAEKFEVSISSIGDVVSGRTYKHVKNDKEKGSDTKNE